jgi:hypothetical protein
MTVCRLVVNTLLGVGMQVVAEAVALGSIPNLPFCGTPVALTDFVFSADAGTNSSIWHQSISR